MTRPIKVLDIIKWRGRVGVFFGKSRVAGKARIRLSGLKTVYLVNIHELRHDNSKPYFYRKIENDPLQILIKKPN